MQLQSKTPFIGSHLHQAADSLKHTAYIGSQVGKNLGYYVLLHWLIKLHNPSQKWHYVFLFLLSIQKLKWSCKVRNTEAFSTKNKNAYKTLTDSRQNLFFSLSSTHTHSSCSHTQSCFLNHYFLSASNLTGSSVLQLQWHHCILLHGMGQYLSRIVVLWRTELYCSKKHFNKEAAAESRNNTVWDTTLEVLPTLWLKHQQRSTAAETSSAFLKMHGGESLSTWAEDKTAVNTANSRLHPHLWEWIFVPTK